MRLIDADNAISVLEILADKCDNSVVWEQAIAVLKDVPTIKAEPKYGRWIKRGDNSWECSVCHEISCCNGNYCVDCGAKMNTPNNAHWIKQLNGEYKCSVCGDTTLAPLYECGTCGAKMGGVENE